MSKTTDKKLLSALQKGNRKALEELYLVHRDAFVQWLRQKYNCSQEEALEVYQDTILAFYRNVLNGKVSQLSSSLKTYLYAIGKNTLQAKRRKFRLETHEVEQETLQPLASEDVEKNNQRKERSRILLQLLKQLGEPCLSLLKSHYLFDKSLKETAKELGYKSMDVVYTQKNRCLKRLKTLTKKLYKRDEL